MPRCKVAYQTRNGQPVHLFIPCAAASGCAVDEYLHDTGLGPELRGEDVDMDVVGSSADAEYTIEIDPQQHDQATVELAADLLRTLAERHSPARAAADDDDDAHAYAHALVARVDAWIRARGHDIEDVQIAKLVPCIAGNFGCASLGRAVLESLRRRMSATFQGMPAQAQGAQRPSQKRRREESVSAWSAAYQARYAHALGVDMLHEFLVGCDARFLRTFMRAGVWAEDARDVRDSEPWRTHHYADELRDSGTLVLRVDDLQWSELGLLLRQLRADASKRAGADSDWRPEHVELRERDGKLRGTFEIAKLFDKAQSTPEERIVRVHDDKAADLFGPTSREPRDVVSTQYLSRAALLCALSWGPTDVRVLNAPSADARAAEAKDDDESMHFARAFADAAALSTSLVRVTLGNWRPRSAPVPLDIDALRGKFGDEQGHRLDLSHRNLGLVSTAVIAACLKGNDVLQTLDIGRNRFESEGAKAIGDALRVNGALTSLDLSGNRLVSTIECDSEVDGASVAGAIVAFKGREYTVSEAQSDEYYAALADLSGIKAIADALRVNGALTDLNLELNRLGDDGAKAISDALCVNGALTSLNLAQNKLGVEGGKAIAEAVRVNGALTSLDLSMNELDAEGAIGEALRVNGALTSINLLRNPLDVASANALAEIAKQKGISLCGIGPDQTEANFSDWDLKPADAILLASDLLQASVSGALTDLNLRSNQIGVEGAEAIADALRVNGALTFIGEGGLNLKSNSLGDQGWGAIISAVCASKVSKISSIDASDEGIGPAGAKLIGEALRTSVNGALTSLDIHWNDFGRAGEGLLRAAETKSGFVLNMST